VCTVILTHVGRLLVCHVFYALPTSLKTFSHTDGVHPSRKRTWNENQETILWSIQTNPKIYDRSSKLQKLHCNWRAICVRFACRSRCVVHVVWPFDEKGFPIGPIVRFKSISNSQWSLVTLRALHAMQAGPLARFRPISVRVQCQGNTLCFALILVPCTFKKGFELERFTSKPR
jgi:hypothetical protein